MSTLGAEVAGATVSVVAIVVVVALVSAGLLSPQEVTNTPRQRATIDNFTNFIIPFFSWLCTFIPVSEKGNPR